MTSKSLEADYVVVGGGACGLSFTDVVLSESDADVIVVDKRAHPGGHWNDAYSFVRLHQPSSIYGVNSKPLGRGHRDVSGTNAGLLELATGDEVRTYFDELMHDQFLPSGRVRYLPMSEYADGQVTSLLTGETVTVRARRKTVDARYVGSEVPATRPPSYPVAPDVSLVPVNGLPRVDAAYARYVIIGGGKTGADACIWLLGQGVEPSAITWIRSRDPWFFDRANLQSGPESFERTMGSFATVVEAASQAETVDGLFARLEDAGIVLRIDPGWWPTMWRGATATRGEIDLLAQVTDVVRLGRVLSIDGDAITLEEGTVPAGRDWLFVDCSAPGVPPRPAIPVFDGDRITLQYVMFGGFPTYSAALTAFVELTQSDDATKNALCPPMPVTGDLENIAHNLLADIEVRGQWLGTSDISDWMSRSRLELVMGEARRIDPADEAKQAAVGRFLVALEPARCRLEQILTSAATA